MPSAKNRTFSVLTIACDILSIVGSVFSAFHLRFRYAIIPLKGHAPDFSNYFQPLLIILLVYLVFFRAYGLYDFRRQIRRIEEIFRVIKATFLSVFVLMALTFLYRQFSYSRAYLIILWACSITYVSLARYLLIQWEYQRRQHHKDVQRVLLVGANPNARHIIEWARHNKHYGREILGVLAGDASSVGKHFEEVPILGTIQQCESFIEQLHPHEVILLDTNVSRARIADLVALCEDQFIEFKLGADIYGLMTRNVDVEYISTVPLLGFRALPLDDLWNRAVKRAFDIVVSALLLFLTSPLWVFAVFSIKWTDGGPVFYQQERMGRDQKIFKVLKFRTMKVDAEKETGPVWAGAKDRRTTPPGQLLRRWNIDELPQLWNVLKGDMSLVGPRPERPHFIHQFREALPRYMARHKIKSGLTGWAQVHGYRGNTSIEERLKYDLYYMENWSLMLDIEILLMTLFAFRNAY